MTASLAALALLLVLSFAPSASSASSAAASSKTSQRSKNNADALHTLPLIPHHSNEARRRVLLSSSTVDSTTSPATRSTRQPASSIRSRRMLDAHQTQLGALYQGYGTHYVDLWVGTPPQRQTLIVDTGSGVTAFPCTGCKNPATCGQGHHIDNFFNDVQSSSFQKLGCKECDMGHCSFGSSSCKIGVKYLEGSSWSAYEARDDVYIGGPHDHGLESDNGGKSDLDPNHAFAFSFLMTFGCQTKLTGDFITQLADGIMGMDDAGSAFWSQMYSQNIIQDKKFSLCLARQATAEKAGTEAGAMTMGGYDERLHTSPMVYASRYGDGRFYNVHVRKIYLRHGSGGEGSMSSNPSNAQVITLQISETNLNHGNVIIDSGNTDTTFSRRIATEFTKAYEQLSGKAYSHLGVSLSEEELRALPTILIQMAGDETTNRQLYPTNAGSISGLAGALDPDHPYDVLLAIPPSHYMEYDDRTNKYYAQIYMDGANGSILGANSMMGHDVFFDLDGKRIGWAESDCDYHELISNNGFVDLIHGGSTSVKPETTTPQSKEDMMTDSWGYALSPNDTSHPSGTTAIIGGVLIGILAFALFVVPACRTGNTATNTRYTAVQTLTSDLELTPPASVSSNAEYYDDDPDNSISPRRARGAGFDGYSDEPAAATGTGYNGDVDISNLRVV